MQRKCAVFTQDPETTPSSLGPERCGETEKLDFFPNIFAHFEFEAMCFKHGHHDSGVFTVLHQLVCVWELFCFIMHQTLTGQFNTCCCHTR